MADARKKRAAPPQGDVEEAFPRGGSDGFTHLERRRIELDAQASVAAEMAAGGGVLAARPTAAKRPKRNGSSAADGEDAEDTFFKRATLQGNVAKYVELLKFKNLTVGSRIWGIVLEVSPRGLAVSLPHGLRGHVALKEASDVLAQMNNPASKAGAAQRMALGDDTPPSLMDLFSVGQYVRCVVLSLDQGVEAGARQGGEEGSRRGKHVELSLQLKRLCSGLGPESLHEGAAVPAVVRSVEDHGYVLGFGIKAPTLSSALPNYRSRVRWAPGPCSGASLARPLSAASAALRGALPDPPLSLGPTLSGPGTPGTLPSCSRPTSAQGASGFLRKRDHQAAFGAGSALLPGALLEVVVTEAAGAAGRRGVTVSSCSADVASAVTKEVEGLNLLSLMPGALVNARVRAVLSDGLMVTFLTYFHGTIDPFHVAVASPGAGWKGHYQPGQRLRARILYINPAEKRVGLSLLPHLQAMTLPSPTPMLGQVFEEAVIKRIDAGLGLLLLLPMSPVPCTGHVHISNASDDHVDKLEAAFKVGQTVKARVIGFRLVDALATLTMRASAVAQTVLSARDLHPGMPVTGTVAAVEDFGLIVSITPALRAMVPTLHMSDLGHAKARSKFKVGQQVTGRVLWVGDKRLMVTLKKGLLGSKLPVISSLEQAVPGCKAHGVVTGCQPYGIFVTFYNDVQGLLHVKELTMAAGQKPEDLYSVGQVIKVRVEGVDPRTHRLSLRLSGAKKAAGGMDAGDATTAVDNAINVLGSVQPGELVEGTVKQVQESNGRVTVLLAVDSASAMGIPARLDALHLSDHPAAVDGLRAALYPGAKLGQLLVLERLEAQKVLRVTRKASLMQVAASMPRTFDAIKQTALLTGFVANVTSDAVYVRFLGGLTGRAGLGQISDKFVSQPSLHFSEGQSVRCQVVTVDTEKQRFSVSLKPSLVGSSDAAYLHALLRDQEAAERLRCERDGEPYEAWPPELCPGRIANAVVSKVEPYGTVCDVEGFEDYVGIITAGQTDAPEDEYGRGAPGTQLVPGTTIQPRIVDYLREGGIVELSLRPEVVLAGLGAQEPGVLAEGTKGTKGTKGAKGKKKAAKVDTAAGLQVGAAVDAIVVAVKQHYLVLVLPGHGGALAFAPAQDFNCPRPEDVPRSFETGQKVKATLQVLPGQSTGGRLLAYVDLHKSGEGSQRALTADGKKAMPKPGVLLTATVTAVQPLQLDVVLGRKMAGHVHISQALDLDDPAVTLPVANPLEQYSVQQTIKCVLLSKPHGTKSNNGYLPGALDLSLRPSLIKAAEEGGDHPPMPRFKKLELERLAPGQRLVGFVQEVEADCVWLVISPHLRGRLDILQMSDDPDVLAALKLDRFKLGVPVATTVHEVNVKLRQLDLQLVDALSSSSSARTPAPGATEGGGDGGGSSQPAPGRLVMGRVTSVSGTGVLVHLGWRRSGRVALTDLHDVYVPNALEGIVEGTFVRCFVLAVGGGEGTTKCELSLRPSVGGKIAGIKAHKEGTKAVESLQEGALVEDAKLKGYVRRVDANGMFVELDRTHTARVQLRNLADSFVESPATAFPVGSLVEGKLIVPPGTAVSGRIELSLRTGAPGGPGSSRNNLNVLTEGMLCDGKVRRVEAFGVFVDVAATGVSGLCHISEIADGPVHDIGKLYRAGQPVRVKVLRINRETGKVSLGMKPSYFGGPDDDTGPDAPAAASRGHGGDDIDIDEEMAEMEGVSGDADNDVADRGGDPEDEDTVDDDDDDAVDNVGRDESDLETPPSDEDAEDGDRGAMAAARSRPGETSAPMEVDAAAPTWGGLQLQEEAGQEAAAAGPNDGAEEDGGPTSKKSKGAKKRLKEEKERQIRAAEMARLSGNAAPQTEVDFERLCVGSPNSSFVWIKYMAFLIALGDVPKARAIAEKALSTIHFREESEKFNIWVAWLNLEAAYGLPDPTEALMALFSRALQYNDQKKLYFALLGICDRTERTELRDQTLRTMCKKFPTSAKVWLRAVEARLTAGDSEGSRKLLDRAIAALPARKHIKVITQAGLLEFRLGSAERGRGVLEGVLRNYPKRLDLWSVYLDQEIKLGDKQRTRALFERATHLSLPPKKMKFLFRRYLEYEKAHGDSASVEHVKKRAMEFVASAPA